MCAVTGSPGGRIALWAVMGALPRERKSRGFVVKVVARDQIYFYDDA